MAKFKNDQEREAARLRNKAFTANRRAKTSTDAARVWFYQNKDAAINASLEAGYAIVDSVDWSQQDPVIGITFIVGGHLHTKASCLNRGARHVVRASN